MAWTVSRSHSVFGNKRTVILELTADAATQAVDTGLSLVDGFSVGAKSLSTAAVKIYANVNASGVAAVGFLGCSGFVSGDVLFVTVYGR